MGEIKLRNYQTRIVEQIHNAFKKNYRKILIELGCGGGKSIIIADCIKRVTDGGKRALFLVHREELCDQIRKTLASYDVDMELCEVGMMVTMANAVKKEIKIGQPETLVKKPLLIIVDECHHAMNNSYQTILDYFKGAFLIGFTATPYRLDGQDLMDNVFEKKIKGPTVKWLIENHYLAPYKLYGSKLISSDDLKAVAGEYTAASIDNQIKNNKTIWGDAVNNYLRIAKGKKTIVYLHKVEAAEDLAYEYRSKGIKAYAISAKTPKTDRRRMVQQFRDGEITVLCNVDLFGEGFDVPDCECVQILRPTKSFTVWVQQSMRSMRYKEGKTAIIIDHTDNHDHFGEPTGFKPNSKIKWPMTRDCPICSRTHMWRTPEEYEEAQSTTEFNNFGPYIKWPKIPCQEEGCSGDLSFPLEKRQKLNMFKRCPTCSTTDNPTWIYASCKKCPKCGRDIPHTGKEYVSDELQLISTSTIQLPNYDSVLSPNRCRTWNTLWDYGEQQGYKMPWWCINAALERNIEIPAKYQHLADWWAVNHKEAQ